MPLPSRSCETCGSTYIPRRVTARYCKRKCIRSRLTHGHSYEPEYHVWITMRARCQNPSDQAWADYGGRGITVCERWSDFEVFLADMGTRPSADHTIDRIKVNERYEPGNCRWATMTEQNRNQRRTKLTMEIATQIRARVDAGERRIEVASAFSITKKHLESVVGNKIWRRD